MKNFVTTAPLLFVALSAISYGQELEPSEEAVVKAQTQSHVEYYYSLYYERNEEALSTEIFSLPWFITSSSGITVRSTEKENLEYFSSAIAGLLELGWDKSTFRTKNVCVFGSGSAIVSGTNTRTRADDSIISVGGVSYVLGITDEGWRIISFTSHPPDKIVYCDAE
ncbi:MAG: hypothetical protein CMQ41_03345 [Gammaproteobacteria bacterium]|nr:hypothetical protein [Gammaproteobacteria bacterium]|tara:strand:- start:1328 stop:1828 length:501 start_codon:yes stop_codon:yes gene_type:complete